jgi:hypothetical protein
MKTPINPPVRVSHEHRRDGQHDIDRAGHAFADRGRLEFGCGAAAGPAFGRREQCVARWKQHEDCVDDDGERQQLVHGQPADAPEAKFASQGEDQAAYHEQRQAGQGQVQRCRLDALAQHQRRLSLAAGSRHDAHDRVAENAAEKERKADYMDGLGGPPDAVVIHFLGSSASSVRRKVTTTCVARVSCSASRSPAIRAAQACCRRSTSAMTVRPRFDSRTRARATARPGAHPRV